MVSCCGIGVCELKCPPQHTRADQYSEEGANEYGGNPARSTLGGATSPTPSEVQAGTAGAPPDSA